jgi:hypothetical protein
MTVISPLLAILAAQTLDGLTMLRGLDARKPLLALAGVWLAIVAIFLTYGHNNVFLLDGQHTNSLGEALANTEPVRDWKPLLGVLLASGLLLVIQNSKAAVWGATGLGAFLLLITVKPYPLAPEDATVKRAADWFEQYYSTQNSVMCQHALFFYYIGHSRYEFKSYHSPMTDSAVSAAPIGTIIAWESHYGYRPKEVPNSVQYTYFEEQPKVFRRLVDFRSEDNRFGMIFYEKTAAKPNAMLPSPQMTNEPPANE